MKTVVIKPVITEKSMNDATKGVFTFIVAQSANKDNVKVAVEDMYGVHVVKVATNTVKGMRTRFTKLGKNVRDMSYKKARVTLKKGEKIDLFEEVLQEATKGK